MENNDHALKHAFEKKEGDMVTQETEGYPRIKNPHAQALGKLGGQARAKNLTKEQIQAIASKAGKHRWDKKHAFEKGVVKNGG